MAAEFRKRGIKVVLGGPHVTSMPGEAIRHADAIVTGEGELVWPQLLEDFKNNRMKKVYNGGYVPDLSVLPPPRMDVLNMLKYSTNAVIATRGCPYECSYCSIRITSPRFRTRPIEHVVRDLEKSVGNLFQRRIFGFLDDSLAGDRKYFKELMRAITPFNMRWMSQTTLHDFAADDEMVSLAAKSGCRGVFCGIETFNQEALRGANKSFNVVSKYKDYVKRLHDHGICLDAFMMVGFDEDDKSIFERTVETATRLNFDSIGLVIATPYPNTPLFKKLEKEGRLLHRDWSRYDARNVVFVPKQMTPEELFEGWRWVRKEFYRYKSIVKRVWKSGASKWITIPNNLSTRRYVMREENWTFKRERDLRN
jgi:radical SAM superfamily enzyme YgiQ (UPF0313 family)